MNGEMHAHFGSKSSDARSQTNVEACVSPPQATGCRILAGVFVVYFVLCGLLALGGADLTNRQINPTASDRTVAGWLYEAQPLGRPLHAIRSMASLANILARRMTP